MGDLPSKSYFWSRRWVKVLCAAPLVVTLSLMAGAYLTTLPQTDTSSPTPTIDRGRPLMVALGDSFIAGEGAGRYLKHTSDEGKNMCHRANTAYPFLVAQALSFRLVSAACSGAITDDITTRAQHPRSPAGVYGGEPQIKHLTSAEITSSDGLVTTIFDDPADIDVVVLSIGGNDAKFADIVKACVGGRCLRQAGTWMKNLDRLAEKLYDTYLTIGRLAPNARKLVMTYPDLIRPGTCLHELSAPEVAWVRLKFLPQLNRVIATEATNAGWEVVDNTDVFVGARICETAVSKQAANIVKLDQLHGADLNGDLARGSFHPKPLGHRLLAASLARALSTDAPELEPCEPFSSCPLPPPPDPDVPLPGTTQPFPLDARPCAGDVIATQAVLTVAGGKSTELAAEPGSVYCYREWPEDSWKHKTASSSGAAGIPTKRLTGDETLSIEALTQLPDATWRRTVLNAAPSSAPEGESGMRALTKYVVIAVVALILVVVLAILPWVLSWLRARRRSRPVTPGSAPTP